MTFLTNLQISNQKRPLKSRISMIPSRNAQKRANTVKLLRKVSRSKNQIKTLVSPTTFLVMAPQCGLHTVFQRGLGFASSLFAPPRKRELRDIHQIHWILKFRFFKTFKWAPGLTTGQATDAIGHRIANNLQTLRRNLKRSFFRRVQPKKAQSALKSFSVLDVWRLNTLILWTQTEKSSEINNFRPQCGLHNLSVQSEESVHS